ncbi:hypothetical protein B484DRAFT_95222, partial [Ochromonadaceae sp. CCMP2298]
PTPLTPTPITPTPSANEVGLQFAKTRIVFDKILGREEIFGRQASDIIKPIEFEFNKDLKLPTSGSGGGSGSGSGDKSVAKSVGGDKEPEPSFDILYLDSTMRVQRTNKGYYFVVLRDTTSSTSASTSTSSISTGGGIARGSGIAGGAAGFELGPWLTDKIGSDGMRALGLISLTPYLGFLYRFLQGS